MDLIIEQSIVLFLPKSAYIENKFHSSGQKKELMAKRYQLVHAHEIDSGMAIASVR